MVKNLGLLRRCGRLSFVQIFDCRTRKKSKQEIIDLVLVLQFFFKLVSKLITGLLLFRRMEENH